MIWMSIVPSGTPFFMKVRLIECSKLLLWTSKDSSFRYLMEKSRKLKDSSACFSAAATTYTVDPERLCRMDTAKDSAAMNDVFPFFLATTIIASLKRRSFVPL